MFGRLSWLLAVVSVSASLQIAWAQGDARANAGGADGSNAWAGNIKVSDEELTALVDEGVKKSSAFRAAAERLSRSDVIVFVRPDVTASGTRQGRLAFVSYTEGSRYLVIRVPTAQPKPQQLAILGYELQQAAEVANAPAVIDSLSLERELERIASARPGGVFTPPVPLSQALPQWRPPNDVTSKREYSGAVKVLVDASGKVTSAAIERRIHPFYDGDILIAARRWRYKPATRDGKPVDAETTVEIRLEPPGH